MALLFLLALIVALYSVPSNVPPFYQHWNLTKSRTVRFLNIPNAIATDLYQSPLNAREYGDGPEQSTYDSVGDNRVRALQGSVAVFYRFSRVRINGNARTGESWLKGD